MKLVIICTLVLLALVHGRPEPDEPTNSRPEASDAYSAKSEGNERICEPGSTKKIECNRCFCTADGTRWGCTRIGCSVTSIYVINEEGASVDKPQSD